MVINGFIEEETLNQLYTDGEISASVYVKHHSQEMLDDYNRFLETNELEDSEDSADQFLSDDDDDWDFPLTKMSDGEDDNDGDDIEANSIDIFKEWTRNNLKLEMLLGSDEAVNVTLWRYNNPNSENQTLCAEQCHIDEAEVHEWWNTIDFVVGSMGGSHFTMANPTYTNMKSVIQDAVTAAFIQ